MSGYTIAEFHGAVTHFPIAFLIGVFAFDIGALLFKKPEWKVVSFWMLVAAVLSCLPTLLSGNGTGRQIFGSDTALPDIAVTHRFCAYLASGFALVLLAARIRAKDQLSGAGQYFALLLLIVATGAVSYTGFLGGKMVFGSSSNESQPTPTKPESAATVAQIAAIDPNLISDGKKDYGENGCSNCHKINNSGGSSGPNLTHEGSQQSDQDWQIKHLKNPKSTNPSSFMPAYASLPPAKLKALAAYLVSLK